jgi:hypothetical protein
MPSKLGLSRAVAVAVLATACGEAPPLVDPVPVAAVPAGASVVTIAGAGIQEAVGERIIADPENCDGFFTRNCVVCRDVTMSAIVSGPAGTTAVLDSARSSYTYLLPGYAPMVISRSQAVVAEMWGTTVLEAGRVYTTNPQSFKGELPFRVNRTFFFRSGDLATRGTFSFAFTCT